MLACVCVNECMSVCETVCVCMMPWVCVWVGVHTYERVWGEKEMVITNVLICFQQKSAAYIASSSHTLFPNGP